MLDDEFRGVFFRAFWDTLEIRQIEKGVEGWPAGAVRSLINWPIHFRSGFVRFPFISRNGSGAGQP